MKLESTIILNDIEYPCTLVTRDWDTISILGKKFHKPKGRLFEIIIDNNLWPCRANGVSVSSMSWGSSLEEATQRLKRQHAYYLMVKDMTREEFDEWKKL